MGKITTLFYNALPNMDKEEMLSYLKEVFSEEELRAIFKQFNEDQKGRIFDYRFNAEIKKIFQAMTTISEKLAILHAPDVLKKMEGRIWLLLLTKKLAENIENDKLLLETSNQINSLFMEYRRAGGREMFYESDPNHG